MLDRMLSVQPDERTLPFMNHPRLVEAVVCPVYPHLVVAAAGPVSRIAKDHEPLQMT